MKLVIAEKAIAGRRIAQILSTDSLKEQRKKNALFFEFGRKGEPYTVIPLKGHIMDVDFPKHLSPWLGTDLVKLSKSRVLYTGKEKGIVSLLKSRANEFDEVIFATDSDREGESIALESLKCLKEKNEKIKTKRANFSAITREEIEDAFSDLNKLDYNFADSADARREIDLIWGAVLTRFLSLVSGRLGKAFLSAGRVQSPTLNLIVKKEKEILAFDPKKYWELEAIFEKEKKKFKAKHKKGRFWKKEEAKKAEKKADFGTVKKTSRKKKRIPRPKPFNTTSFLRAANAIGFSASHAMSIAENLYQRGLISYPRTDNTVFSPSINLRKILESLLRIDKFYSDVEKLLAKKKLKPSRGKKASKDHPPIHPVGVPKEKLSKKEWRVYELVCRRFFAVLSEAALVESMRVDIDLASEPYVARGKRFIKRGWKDFYPYSKAKEVILPELQKGDRVKLLKLNFLSKETRPPAHYSQGTLIKEMAAKNLGTKSTRHETIKKLYSRNYIRGGKKIKPNKIGIAVIEALEEFDGTIIESEMTAELEKEMDEIAAGKKEKEGVVKDSRKLLQTALEQLLKNKDEIGKTLRSALRKDKEKFPCPRDGCNGMLVVRRGKSNKRFLGCTSYPKCTETYPLPQKGYITPLKKHCEECSKPMIRVKTRKYAYTMCIDPNCKSKEDWGKKGKKNAKKKK